MALPAVAPARLPARRMRAAPHLAVLFVLGCILQPASAAIETLKTHGDLNAAMMQSDRVGVLVWFGGAYESLQLPASEGDTREAAWFTKLDHIWQRDVLTQQNRVDSGEKHQAAVRPRRPGADAGEGEGEEVPVQRAVERPATLAARVQRAVRAVDFEGRNAHLRAVGQPGAQRREGGAVRS